jgi:hypothetical protein
MPDCLKSLGDTYRETEPHSAIPYYKKALALYQGEECEDQLGEANCRSALGFALWRLPDLIQARDQLERAARIYSSIKHFKEANSISQTLEQLALQE